MCHGVIRVVAHSGLKGGAGAVQITLACIDHGQVVIGLGQLWVVLGQQAEGGDGVFGLAIIGQRNAAQKTHLRVTCILG